MKMESKTNTFPSCVNGGACVPEEWNNNNNNNTFPEYPSIVTWRQREFENAAYLMRRVLHWANAACFVCHMSTSKSDTYHSHSTWTTERHSVYYWQWLHSVISGGAFGRKRSAWCLWALSSFLTQMFTFGTHVTHSTEKHSNPSVFIS
jgi:hypothetical protein